MKYELPMSWFINKMYIQTIQIPNLLSLLDEKTYEKLQEEDKIVMREQLVAEWLV